MLNFLFHVRVWKANIIMDRMIQYVVIVILFHLFRPVYFSQYVQLTVTHNMFNNGYSLVVYLLVDEFILDNRLERNIVVVVGEK